LQLSTAWEVNKGSMAACKQCDGGRMHTRLQCTRSILASPCSRDIPVTTSPQHSIEGLLSCLRYVTTAGPPTWQEDGIKSADLNILESNTLLQELHRQHVATLVCLW
jgi:hypothetical protein